MLLLLATKLSLFQAMSFLTSTILVLSPISLCRVWVAVWCLVESWSCGVGSATSGCITLLSMKKQKVRAVFCKLKSWQCFYTKCCLSTGKYLDFQHLQLYALVRNFQQRRSSKRFTGRMLKNSECPKDSLDQTTDILLILLSLFLPGLQPFSVANKHSSMFLCKMYSQTTGN